MRAVCPADPRHTRFTATAHVTEEWLMEADGTFVEVVETLESVHRPDRSDIWTCYTCGATAEFLEEG